MIGEVIRSGLEFQSHQTDATAPKPSVLHIVIILKYHQANAEHDLTHESVSVDRINIY